MGLLNFGRKKELTPEQLESKRTKDFFDMILPSTIKFLTDHYIIGDSYRCAWAIREYPPSTEEQAILAQLADKNGVTLRIDDKAVVCHTANEAPELFSVDALLDAGGQIIVKHGFHGKGNGILQSKSNVICKFIENGKVFAGGYVESGSVLTSEITAKGDVNICSKKGFIAGSIVRTIGNVSAVTIGSEIESKTSIEAGVDADARDRLKVLLKEAEEAEKRLSELGTSLSFYKNMLASSSKVDAKKILRFKQIAAESIRMQTLLNTDNEEIEHIRASLSEMSTARISVEHDIYPGVNLTIASYQRMLDKKFSHCYFVVTEGEIRMTAM